MSRIKLAKAKSTTITVVLLCLAQPLFTPAANSAPREVTITLSADDNISGVAFMQIAEDKNNPPPPVVFNRTAVVTTEASILWVRAQDRALNWSAWVGVQVGGAPVIQDPLAKTVYVPVALVPYVPPAPTVETPTASTPTSAPSAGFAPGGISLPLPEVSLIETSTAAASVNKAETETVKSPIAPQAVVETSVATAPIKVELPKETNPAALPAGIKIISLTTKASVVVKLSNASQQKISVGVSKVLEVKVQPIIGAKSIKASVTDSTGKKLILVTALDKKSGKITIPKLTFSKKGVYQLSIFVANKAQKITIRVS